MDIITTRSLEASSRQQLILVEALRLFTELPYDQVSIDMVCERAGAAHGLVSYHFGGKRGLFAAAAELAWSEFTDFQRPPTSDESPVQRIRGYLTRHFQWVSDYPEKYRFLIRSELANAELVEIMRNARQRALSEVAACLGCPDHPPPKLRIALISWSGFLDSATLDWMKGEDLGLGYVIDLCVQALVASVRAVNGIGFEPEDEARALVKVSAP